VRGQSGQLIHESIEGAPLLLLGACAGAQTVTAAMAEVQDKSGSRTPVLGYTVPYAIGNILLTIWGSIIVTLMAN